MYKIIHDFLTASRDEFAETIEEFANSLIPLLEHERPIVIEINGSNDAGKTFVWDIIRRTLIPDAIKTHHAIPSSLLGEHRDEETWSGQLKGTDQNLKICCIDATGAKTGTITRLESNKRIQHTLGDIILVNNTQGNSLLRRGKTNPHIHISVTIPKTANHEWVRNTKISTLESTAQVTAKQPTSTPRVIQL